MKIKKPIAKLKRNENLFGKTKEQIKKCKSVKRRK